MNDRQRLQAIVAIVCKYLPPDGISREQAMNEIIGLVDPLPEQPEQEPYCWVQSKLNQGLFYKEKPRRIHTISLYTSPPRKEWFGLTNNELQDILDCGRGFWTNAEKIEQLLKDKNI